MTSSLKPGAVMMTLGAIFLASTLNPAHADNARFERFVYSGSSAPGVQPGPGQYQNPILSGFYPDPSLTRVENDYYLVNSSFAYFPGLPVFHSQDLVNWTQIGNAIDRPEQLDLSGIGTSWGAFAPDISYHNGTFYIVNTCVKCTSNQQGKPTQNYLISAKNPAGPWSDPVLFDFAGIDPSIFWDDDGKAYIVNNGAPDEAQRYDGHYALWLQEFDYQNLKLVGERVQIINGGVDIAKKPFWIEGPHIFKKDGKYYLIAAQGGTQDNHSEVVFRADAVFGPYIHFAGNPILTQSTLAPERPHPVTSAGHAKLVETQAGEWWAAFLATRPYADGHYNIVRETFLLPVRWQDGWPIILAHDQADPLVEHKPALPTQPRPALPVSGDFSYTDEFDAKTLSMAWIGVRTPKTPLYKLEDGALILNSGAMLGDETGVPAFVGRRQQHHTATVATTLTYAPQKDGDRAGLAAIQSDHSLLFFGITRIDGKPVVALYTRDNASADTLIAAAPFSGGPVTLTIRATGGTMAFDYTTAKTTKTLTSDLDVRFLSTRSAGGFVGTVIGCFAYKA